MQTLNSFLDQALLIWKDSTAAARFGIALLLTICVGAIIGIGIWSSTPQYVILASDLEVGEAKKMIDALDSANIKYQIQGADTILVDKLKRSRAQIIAQDQGVGSAASTLEDTPIWADPKSQETIRRRNLEKGIADSILNYRSVEGARVHLSIPEKQAFIRTKELPSAAVVLTLRSNSKFGESQASAIASLVANAVNGLTPDNVAISDTFGNEFTTDETNGRLSKQEEFRVMRDYELSQKAEMMLTKILGLGNAIVTVTTDFTFPEGTSTVTEYDPDSKVMVSEVVKNETRTGQSKTAGGTAGTASNLGVGSTNNDQGTTLTKTEDLDNKYEVSSTSRTETITTPIMNMMTVSVVVNSTAVFDENKQVPAQMKERIENLVSRAVGFRESKDEITVDFFDYGDPVPEVEPLATAIPWDSINQILKNASLGLAAIIALFVALKAFKKLQPDPMVTTETSADRGTQVNQLSELVKQNPEVFSKIIESWSSLESRKQDAPDQASDKKVA
ncbi:MAG: flagellar basal-body MS-ring/collar protein FliF [Mariniblastus sp.]